MNTLKITLLTLTAAILTGCNPTVQVYAFNAGGRFATAGTDGATEQLVEGGGQVRTEVDMGFPNSEHIKRFVYGKVVSTIEQDEKGFIFLRFLDGTALRMYANPRFKIIPDVEVITTPYGPDGEVVQSTVIMDTPNQVLHNEGGAE